MTRQETSRTAANYGMLLSGLSAWAVLSYMPQTFGEIICRAGRLSPDAAGGLPELALSWLAMMVAMTAPAAFLARALNRERFAVGEKRIVTDVFSSIPMLVTVALVGAFGEWMFRSARLLDDSGRFIAPVFVPAVLACAVLLLLRDIIGGRGACRAACCITMVLLQFAGGVTNMVWMAALSSWMALESVFPWRRELSAFGAVTLCFAAGFSLLQGGG